MVEYPQRPNNMGVATHMYEPKMMNSWTIALKESPNFCEFYPSRLRILDIRAHFFMAFLRLETTIGQPASMAVMMRTNYLNVSTVVSEFPYARNAVFMPARAYYKASIWWFLSATLDHWAVLRWWSFRATHSTRMSHWEQRGWGEVYSSVMTMLSCKRWCT